MEDLLAIGDARIKEIMDFKGNDDVVFQSLKQKFEAVGLEHLSDEDFLLNLLSSVIYFCNEDKEKPVSIKTETDDSNVEKFRELDAGEILSLYIEMKQQNEQNFNTFLRDKKALLPSGDINGACLSLRSHETIKWWITIDMHDLTDEEICFIQNKVCKMNAEGKLYYQAKVTKELKDKIEKYFFDAWRMNETGVCMTSSILHFLSYEKMDKVINKAIEFFLKYPQLYFRMDSNENFSPLHMGGMFAKMFRFCQVAFDKTFELIDANYLKRDSTITDRKVENLFLKDCIGLSMLQLNLEEDDYIPISFWQDEDICILDDFYVTKKFVNEYLQVELCDASKEDYPGLLPNKFGEILTAGRSKHRTSIRNAKDTNANEDFMFDKARFLNLELFQEFEKEGDKFSRDRNGIIEQINSLSFEGEKIGYENFKKWFDGKIASENEVVCKNCFKLLDEFFIYQAENFKRSKQEQEYGLQIKFFNQCIENASVNLNGLSFPLHEIKNGEDESFWQEYNVKAEKLNEKIGRIKNIYWQIQNLDKAIDDYYVDFKKQFQIATMKEIFPFIEEDFLAENLYQVYDLLNLRMKEDLFHRRFLDGKPTRKDFLRTCINILYNKMFIQVLRKSLRVGFPSKNLL